MTNAASVLKEKRVNGVNLMDLHSTIKAVRQEPELGRAHFRATNQWLGQALNRTTIGNFFAAGEERQHKKEFVFENDEGEVLLGKDQAANPVEFVLHALAGCVTTTTVYHAAALGINIESLETTLEGDIDLRGFLGISKDVPCGYQNIRVTMNIKSDAPADKIEKLKQLYRHSPVFDTLTRAVKVDVNVEPE